MARSINGNLRGAAARLDIQDRQDEEFIRRQKFTRDWKRTLQALEYFMDIETFESWWDGYPEEMTKGEFLPIMMIKLDEVDGTLQTEKA